jgi:branched-subunit amino acid ABC-type transport system permease component
MSAYLIQQFVNGLSVGMVYALMAIGFTLIFGVLNVVNFAHGEIFTIGGFAGLVVIMTFAPPLTVVILIVLAIGVLAGFGLERVAFKPFRRFQDEASLKSRAMRESTLLSSLAISIVIREVIHHVFGSEMQTIPQEYLLQHPIPIGPLSFASGQLIILAFDPGSIQQPARSKACRLEYRPVHYRHIWNRLDAWGDRWHPRRSVLRDHISDDGIQSIGKSICRHGHGRS